MADVCAERLLDAEDRLFKTGRSFRTAAQYLDWEAAHFSVPSLVEPREAPWIGRGHRGLFAVRYIEPLTIVAVLMCVDKQSGRAGPASSAQNEQEFLVPNSGYFGYGAEGLRPGCVGMLVNSAKGTGKAVNTVYRNAAVRVGGAPHWLVYVITTVPVWAGHELLAGYSHESEAGAENPALR